MRIPVIAVSVLLTLTGCTGAGPGPQVDKAGVPVGPVTLRAWSPETADRPSGIQLTAFAEAVERLSGGSMTIDATYGADMTGEDPDTSVIAGVQRGDYDVGLVAARAFSSVGVDSFRALSAPFLIQSDAVAAAVVRDDQVTGPMLDGATGVGLTGLAILPETIRHPFGITGPILGPEDYRGAVLRSLPSAETYAVFSALGAEPGFWDGDTGYAMVADGSIQIVESSFAIAGQIVGRPAIGTGNVAFFPRMNVLFANDQAIGDLDTAQQDLLARAADEAREQAIADVPKDGPSAARYCIEGGRVVLASDKDVAALQQTAAPYLATLEEDPTTRDAIEAIRTIAGRTPDPQPVKACEPGPLVGEDLAPWPVSDSASPLDGRYRVEITDADLEAGDVPESEWSQNHGLYTWTIADGRMTYSAVADNPQRNPTEEFYLTVRGDQAMLMGRSAGGAAPNNRNVLWIGTWSRDDDGTVRFSDHRPGLDYLPQLAGVLWFAKEFTPLQ